MSATNESRELDVPQNLADEAQITSSKAKGGWITFPFISGCLIGLLVAHSGVLSNFIVYLIKEFNVKSIDAAQIFNIINGCFSVAPVVGAVITDSYFGSFAVVVVSTFVSFLSMALFTLSATLKSLRPTPCSQGSDACEPPSTTQLALLYTAVALLCVAAGGTRFNSANFGADQLDTARDQGVFFNWYFCIMYATSIVGATAIVYVQDSISWGLGFGLCAVANALGFSVLMLGIRHYRRPKPEGSPFTGLARVAVAAIRKRKIAVSSGIADYYYGPQEEKSQLPPPSKNLRILNRAAVKTEGDIGPDGSIARPWHLCTVEQVEDLKAIVKILPLWTTSIFVSISIGIQSSLTVLQALTVDRSLSPHFAIPAGSVAVSMLATVALVLPLLDRVIYPACDRLIGRTPTSLQRIGLGHILNSISMVASALVERRRLEVVRSHGMTDQPGSVVPMSVLWLLIPFVLVGIGEALHFPGQIALYYQEFPMALKSSSTGMIALIVALGFYLSTAVIDVVRRSTDWLPDNINAGQMDRVYWMLAIVTAANFGFYCVCAKLYRYRRVDP